MMSLWFMRSILGVLISLVCTVFLAQAEIKIGVNAHRGNQEVFDRWGLLGQYLSTELGDTVTLVPYKVYDVVAGAKKHEIDFVLTATVQTAQMQDRYGTVPIGSINTKTGAQYAGLIVTRKDSGIQQAQHLKGKKVAGLAKTASGGYIFQTYHLLRKGINVHTDCVFQQVQKQDDVVLMVKNGTVDAGFVRAGVLEDMAADGKLKLDDFAAVDRASDAGYPFLHSTAMYADWYMSAMPGTPSALSERVQQALLRLPADSEAAKAAELTGFVAPLPLDGIKDALKALQSLQSPQASTSPK